jgi:sporadic carbohydrate cluster 2OG-Fe(II) oxygenase
MKNCVKHFEEHGWTILDLKDIQKVNKTRLLLLEKLKELIPQSTTLENYHELSLSDEEHTKIQFLMTEFFRVNRFAQDIITSQTDFFSELVGKDLMVQAKPYLRMTRPNRPQDNIGYHRDTFYGGSPFEVSVLIPFVDLPKESSLGVMSGTHVLPESMFPTKQIISEDPMVTKGSDKHKLGFLYAPKIMDSSIGKEMQFIPLNIGQALVFSLATVHGSVINQGNVTRWSTDIRVVNQLAPVDLTNRPDYYEPNAFNNCPLTYAAKTYLKANGVTQ